MTETLSLHEALMISLIDSREVDSSNVVILMRRGEAKITGVWGPLDFALQRDADEVDSILISASGNGRDDLFA